MIRKLFPIFLFLVSSSSTVLAHPYHRDHGFDQKTLINHHNHEIFAKRTVRVVQDPSERWPVNSSAAANQYGSLHRDRYIFGQRELNDDWPSPIRRRRSLAPVASVDNNNCIEGSVIGGILGAGLGAVLSRGEGRWIGVPLGTAAGALVGCQVDGG